MDDCRIKDKQNSGAVFQPLFVHGLFSYPYFVCSEKRYRFLQFGLNKVRKIAFQYESESGFEAKGHTPTQNENVGDYSLPSPDRNRDLMKKAIQRVLKLLLRLWIKTTRFTNKSRRAANSTFRKLAQLLKATLSNLIYCKNLFPVQLTRMYLLSGS